MAEIVGSVVGVEVASGVGDGVLDAAAVGDCDANGEALGAGETLGAGAAGV